MTVIENILRDKRYIELMALKKENKELSHRNYDNDDNYTKLIKEGIKDLISKTIITSVIYEDMNLGLNKYGIGRYRYKISLGYFDNISELYDFKNIIWNKFKNELNLKKEELERFNIIIESLKNYDISLPKIEKKLNKMIIDDSGNKKSIEAIRIHNGLYAVIYNYQEKTYPLLGDKITDFFILKQLYNDFKKLAQEFQNSRKRKLEHNIQVYDKLKEDLAYYFVIDIL